MRRKQVISLAAHVTPLVAISYSLLTLPVAFPACRESDLASNTVTLGTLSLPLKRPTNTMFAAIDRGLGVVCEYERMSRDVASVSISIARDANLLSKETIHYPMRQKWPVWIRHPRSAVEACPVWK